jgi:superfamily II DNA helicase RecQ
MDSILIEISRRGKKPHEYKNFSMTKIPKKILKNVFGFDSFKTLRGEKTVLLREESYSKKTGRSKNKKLDKQKTNITLSNKEDRTLFQTLRTHRLELAGDQKVSPFVIFHDTTLV